MKEQFELIYGFVHCRGRTTYSAGFVDKREEAEAWIRNHRNGTAPKMKIPADDPVRYCPATSCPLKRQKPWFDMMAINSDPHKQ